MTRSTSACAAFVATSILTASAAAGTAETWNFDLTTTGNDVSFDSPTAVNPNAAQYDATVEITLVEISVVWNGIPFGPIDITSEVPPEDLMASDVLDGPLPIVVIEEPFVYPPPPDDPGFAATITVSIDENGFGHGSLTDVTLGDIPYDLGPPFGTVTVTLTSIRVVGSVTVDPLPAPGDLDGNGEVNVFDLFGLLGAWGSCADPCPPSCAADLNGDCAVDVFDLFALLGNWG